MEAVEDAAGIAEWDLAAANRAAIPYRPIRWTHADAEIQPDATTSDGQLPWQTMASVSAIVVRPLPAAAVSLAWGSVSSFPVGVPDGIPVWPAAQAATSHLPRMPQANTAAAEEVVERKETIATGRPTAPMSNHLIPPIPNRKVKGFLA